MAVIQAAQLDGLIKTTQPHIEKDRKATIAQRLTKYTALPMLFRKNKVTVSDGVSIQWNVSTDTSGTAQAVGLFDTIAPATNLHQIQATIPWRHIRTHVSWDLREVAMNRSPARILNYIKEKIYEMDLDEVELIENIFWGAPTAGDDQTPFGIGYYVYSIQDAAGSATGDFASTGAGDRVNLNLAAVSGGPAGISRVTYPRSGNWYQLYVDANYAGLVRNVRQGANATEFESPVSANLLGGERMSKGYYCRQSTQLDLEDVARSQNDRVGPDLAYYDGKTMIRGVPINGIPHLDRIDKARATALKPFYQLDWDQMAPACLEGFENYEVTETGGGNQPMVVTRARYRTFNNRCWNAKSMALYTVA